MKWRGCHRRRAAGVEVAQEVLAEVQSAFLPLAAYLNSLRRVIIAAALAGIAVPT